MIVNIVSVLVGLVALPVALVGLVPFFGIANYLAIPIAVVGAAIGMLSGHKSGRNFNLFVIIVAVIRLFLGGGLF
ncbi:membrane protein [Sphingomonas sp. HMP6]|nr:membrane protein [Sphingomonas sp. HMP6]